MNYLKNKASGIKNIFNNSTKKIFSYKNNTKTNENNISPNIEPEINIIPSNVEPELDMSQYIKEWLALENIVTKPYEQKFLEPLHQNSNDECLKNTDNCNSNDCTVYESSSKNEKMCVSKTRIKNFNTQGIIITGKNNEKYQLLMSNSIDPTLILNDVSSKLEVYYYIYLSLSTNNIYVLFPTGMIAHINYLNINTNDFFKNLVDKIFNLNNVKYNDTKKIIISGHSMGCVLSLCLANLIKQRDEVFFKTNIIIIGSAPYNYYVNNAKSDQNCDIENNNLKDPKLPLFAQKILNDAKNKKHNENQIGIQLQNLENLNNSKNIKIFAYCFIENNNAYVDCYINENFGSNYNPLTYINQYGELVDINKNKYNINYYEFGTKTCNDAHQWDNYYKQLIKMYPIDSVKSGGRKINKQTRKKTNTKKNKKLKNKINKIL